MGSGWLGAVTGTPVTIDGFKIDSDDVLVPAMRLVAAELSDKESDEHTIASILNFDGGLKVDCLPAGKGNLSGKTSKSSPALLGTRGSEKLVLLTLICAPFCFSEQRSDLCCEGQH